MSLLAHNSVETTNRSQPNLLLHAEGIITLAASVLLYHQQGFGWLAFALLLLIPDVSMIGYLINKRVGSAIYNAAHTYSVPLLIGMAGLLLSSPLAVQVALIWFAHIAMDRAIGYGLKYATDFKDTHLSRV